MGFDLNNEYKADLKVNTNNLNLFTKTAYKLISSKRKYLNVFILLASFTISLSCFTEIFIAFCKSFSHAVKLNIALANNVEFISFKYVEFTWSVAWSQFILAIFFLTAFICCIIIGIKILKIYFTFNKLGILIEPCTF